MEPVRVNIMLPARLLKESKNLVKKGYFSNFSEIVREGLRREIINYKLGFGEMTEKDKKLLEWVNNERSKGNILSEKDMIRHGLKL